MEVTTITTHLALELASHGYVVVGINHTYSFGVTTFPDERVVEHAPFNPDTVRDELDLVTAFQTGRVYLFAHNLQFTYTL